MFLNDCGDAHFSCLRIISFTGRNIHVIAERYLQRLRGACYYNKEYFIGVHLRHELDVLNTGRFLFNKNNRTAVVYTGYKLQPFRFKSVTHPPSLSVFPSAF